MNDRPEKDNYRLKEIIEIQKKRIESDSDMLDSLEVLLEEIEKKRLVT